MRTCSLEHITIISGVILLLIGIYGIISQKNIIKMIIGFSIVDTATHVILISIGYLSNRTAPIIDGTVSVKDAVTKVVDPIPQALVLTAIVIGVGVTALMLAYAVKLYEKNNTLEINKFKSLKW